MSRLLSLIAVLLFVFNVSLIAARPQSFRNRSPTPIDVSGLNTNAKRFSRGLGPLRPLVKRRPTGVDSARRSQASQCSKSGVIKVINAKTHNVQGYVSRYLKDHHYSLVKKSNAGLFSSAVFTSGKTVDINLLDMNGENRYLAGLIKKNERLGAGPNNAAILGNSQATNPGATPQSNKDPSSPNDHDAETAIWTYNRNDDSLTATWVNYPGQTPSSTSAYIYWIQSENAFYLTDSPSSDGVPVLFEYIATKGHCAL